MISYAVRGSFKNLDTFLSKMTKNEMFRTLDSLAQEGVRALRAATPIDSGITASSWSYKINASFGGCTISWQNSHVVGGVPIAIILQYGHGTGTGGYVAGRDYINPAMKPVFDKIAERAWKVVTSA